ncbi:MAG TPA: hypothetical protein VJ824_04805 [Bacillota bacterium]|nr:hypothetical protein [Bacillota bacterium]
MDKTEMLNMYRTVKEKCAHYEHKCRQIEKTSREYERSKQKYLYHKKLAAHFEQLIEKR